MPKSRAEPDVLGAVAQRRQVGDQADEPEEQRDGAVGGDREHVPDQRAAELRPDPHGVGIRQQPVGGQPRAAGVHQREQQRAGDREQRHRFREAVDRSAPVLLEQQQDRRDQRAGVADADPPDEVDDREAPADRDVDAPDPGALDQQVGQRQAEHRHPHQADEEPEEPAEGMTPRQDDRGDLLGDTGERVARCDDRRRRVGGFRVHQCSVRRAPAGSSSGLGFRSAAR